MDPRPHEVAWYREHGKYPERIGRTNDGREFVIGDWSWNLLNPTRQEVIEQQMESSRFANSESA